MSRKRIKCYLDRNTYDKLRKTAGDKSMGSTIREILDLSYKYPKMSDGLYWRWSLIRDVIKSGDFNDNGTPSLVRDVVIFVDLNKSHMKELNILANAAACSVEDKLYDILKNWALIYKE